LGVGVLADGFAEKWEGRSGGLKGNLRRAKPLRDRIGDAIRRIEVQLSKIDAEMEQYARREKSLLEKIIQAYEKHDEERAKIIANEIAEIRKHRDLLISSKLSLDGAALRLRTIYEAGDFMSVLCSAREAIREVRSKIIDSIPQMNLELGHVEDMLNSMIAEMGQRTGELLNFNVESEEAERILEEASLIAKKNIEIKFPNSQNR